MSDSAVSPLSAECPQIVMPARATVDMRKIAIYHGNCFDGFTAAWIAQRWTEHWHGAQFIAAKYGEPPPDVDGADVLIVDFSYPRDVLLAMRERACRLQVIDHHKTAQADLAGLEFCAFDMERSGAGLVWDLLVTGSRPDLVKFVEDRDLWRFKYEETKHVLAYVATRTFEFTAWDQMANKPVSELVSAGQYIQEYIDAYGRKAVAEARMEVIGGVRMPTINLPYMNCSDHVNRLLVDGNTVAAGYFRRRDGHWQFSLRSLSPFDSSAIAKQYGGGGHTQAAGFDVERLPWEAA